jgi:hypothetical protein
VGKPHVRTEKIVARVLAQRGEAPGLVHVISAMEPCDAYKPWHDKRTHKTFIRPDSGKCLHYDFSFMDAKPGLIYLRVPTWARFRLQFCCKGHNWLARELAADGIGYPWPMTPSCRSMIGRVRRPSPTASRWGSCTPHWTATPRSAVRPLRCSGRTTTGA